MSIAAMSYVWEHSRQEGGALLVLLALADYANDQGEAYPSVKTLAKKSRLSERQTQRVIQQLIINGDIEQVPNAGPRGVNVHRIARKRTKGDNMTGVQPVTGRGDMGDAKGVTPTAPNPSGNHHEPLDASLFPLPAKPKKQKIGTVNGHKPSQKEIEDFCESIDLPRIDGELMLLKWNADGWPKNWMDKIRYWKRAGFMPSQRKDHRCVSPSDNNSRVAPKGWLEWIDAHPQYKRDASSGYRSTPEFIRLEFTRDRKTASK